MRKALYVAVVAVTIMFSVNSYAEEQKVSPKVEQVSKQLGITIEEATKLVDNMQELAQMMGLKPATTEEQKKDDAKKAASVTGPEVANKALDMAGNAVSTISAQIEKAAPQVWRIMIKQQYANAIFWLSMPLGFFIVALIYVWRSGKWTFENFPNEHPTLTDKRNCKEYRAISQVLLTATSTIWLVIAFGFAIRYLINPEYYAIRNMFQIVLGLK